MKQNILSWLSFNIIFLILFSCKKEDKTLPLKPGKYHVEYTIRYSNGNTEHSEYLAYGPRSVFGGSYVFDVKLTDSTNFVKASISHNGNKLIYFSWLTHYSVADVAYKISSYDCSKENLNILYHDYADTISGTIVFNLIEE